MSDDIVTDETLEELKPKPLPKLAPRGIRTFTVCRHADESGVSGGGVVIEGIIWGTGQCIVHWLYPPPRGGFAIFDSLDDFLKVHVHPHPGNGTLITYDDGEQVEYGGISDE
jgi:hypothetical protein